MIKIALSGEAGKGLHALVDEEDIPVLGRISWTLLRGYAFNVRCGAMHSLVLGYPYANHLHHVDHADGNRLNNTKANLRMVTRQQNNFNARKRKGKCSSVFKGVYRESKSRKNPWFAQIAKTIDGAKMTFRLGSYATEEEAASAYDAKAREIFGEYAVLNFPHAD